MRIERHDLDGTGERRTRVYAMPVKTIPIYGADFPGVFEPAEYSTLVDTVPILERAVTDVPCPCGCLGTIRWAEAGRVPWYRICDKCGRHFIAGGTAAAPTLMRVRQRRSEGDA